MKVASTILESAVATQMLYFLCQAAALRMLHEWGKGGDWGKGGEWGKGDWHSSHADTATSGLLSNHA